MTRYQTIKRAKESVYGDADWLERVRLFDSRPASKLADLGGVAEQERAVDEFLKTPNQCVAARNRNVHRNTLTRLLDQWMERHAL